MPRDSAAADRPASYLVGTAAAFPLFFRDRTKPINQLPFSPSAKFPKSGSSCESRVSPRKRLCRFSMRDFVRNESARKGHFMGAGLVRELAHLEFPDPPIKERGLRPCRAHEPPHRVDHAIREKL